MERMPATIELTLVASPSMLIAIPMGIVLA